MRGDRPAGRGATLAAVALGGAIGASCRHGWNVAFAGDPEAFPLATLSENIVGAFALGLAMVVITDRLHTVRHLQPMLCTGGLGSFTTFSNYSVEAVVLVDHGRLVLAATYLWGSIAAGLVAGLLGMATARWLGRRHRRKEQR